MGLIRHEFFSRSENDFSNIFRVLSHPCRLRIIATLLVQESMTVGEMTEQFNGLVQSSLSEHIRQLKDVGLISGTQVGNTMRYSLVKATWEHVRDVLATVANDNEFMLL